MSHEHTIPLETADPDMGDPHASTILYGGVVGAIIVIALILALEALYFRVEATSLAASYASPYRDVSELVARQTARLHSVGWVNPEDRKLVHIPIERAIGLAVADINAGKKPAPATKPAAKP
ncbi:MAG: hypothetical protein U1D55_05580 [Phycisphaerae bacterium]